MRRIHRNKFFIALVTALLLVSASATAFTREVQPIDGELSQIVQDIVASGKAKGAVLSVVKDGEIALCEGYGYVDEHNGIEADGAATAFRIGSVSKTFVAIAAQILYEDGKLDMDSDIATYLEADFPPFAYPVTMRQLLTHTAGFEDLITGIAVHNISDTEPLAVGIRKYMPAQVFRPGTVMSYSNYGIALAAYVVERISQQDFGQFCRENIFLPLGMDHTTHAYMHDVAYVSKPYLPDGRETLEPYVNLYPEGSAVSTAQDMANYMLWLLNPDDSRILSSQAKHALFEKQFSMDEAFDGIGYVWLRNSRNGSEYYHKKGETLHFYTRIALYPDQNAGVFLSFNTYLPEEQINAMIEQATSILLGKEQPPAMLNAKQTIDIGGLYANNCSSFRTPEKLLRYIVPGKLLRIAGNRNTGYTLNGQPLALIGNDLYDSPMGRLKFQRIDGAIVLSTESAITYSKVSFWQSTLLQAVVPPLFAVLALACILSELALLIANRRRFSAVTLGGCAAALLAFVVLCVLLYHGIASFAPLKLALPLKVCGWLIAASIAGGVVTAIARKAGGEKLPALPVIWTVSGIAFCAWMMGMHLL